MTCAVPTCGNTKLLARGWCESHYRRWQRHGDPEAGREPAGVTFENLSWLIENGTHPLLAADQLGKSISAMAQLCRRHGAYEWAGIFDEEQSRRRMRVTA